MIVSKKVQRKRFQYARKGKGAPGKEGRGSEDTLEETAHLKGGGEEAEEGKVRRGGPSIGDERKQTVRKKIVWEREHELLPEDGKGVGWEDRENKEKVAI